MQKNSELWKNGHWQNDGEQVKKTNETGGIRKENMTDFEWSGSFKKCIQKNIRQKKNKDWINKKPA